MLANKLMGAGGAGGAGPASDTLTWRSHNETTFTGAGGTANNGSISSINIGTAASDRWVFVTVSGYTGDSFGSRQVNGITIAGGAATISARASNILFTATGWRLVTAGTTCDISFTLNGNGSANGNAAISVWTINAATVSLVVSDEDGGFSAPGTKTLNLTGSHDAAAFALIDTYAQNASEVTYDPGTTRYYDAGGTQIGDHIFPDAGTNPTIVVPYSDGGSNYQWASLFDAT
jgi:hypothetical protein